MKNAYLLSYFPIISISLSFAIYGKMQMLMLFRNLLIVLLLNFLWFLPD
ncbi:hypothetical protein [Peribacillus simplex]|uniref:Uncharacterized protein n=1 Tax=Peribacillus simplex TaxID=1478 RepID=A0AAW7IC97_9BACI|nr:hypothetical protein [Peribacillus simplex]MDM5451597.1 hypothetical protein [Peribacillus simplex]